MHQRGEYRCRSWRTLCLLALQCFWVAGYAQKLWTSRPGGAGYAMLFDDSVVTLRGLKGMPPQGSNGFTFEAWLSTTDSCHESTIISYAKQLVTANPLEQDAASNHFIVYNTKDIIACHDFPILRSPLDNSTTCDATFKNQKPVSPFEPIDGEKDSVPPPISATSRDNGWHHLAVTWTALNNGTTSVYIDGALRASAQTGKVQPVVADGLLMLGQDQDCFGGCTDTKQAFYGLMDEVRIWKTARTHEQIAKNMRYAFGLEKDPDLLAYWKFDDPDVDMGMWRSHMVALDSGPYKNHINLMTPPQVFSPKNASVPITQGGRTLAANQLVFQRNYLLGLATEVPLESFTLEFWARGVAVPATADSLGHQLISELSETYFSYATTDLPGLDPQMPKGTDEWLLFMDDAIKVERVLVPGVGADQKPKGLIRVFVNSNSQAGAALSRTATSQVYKEHMVEFAAGWTDDKWHHVAVAWDQASGLASVYLDGEKKPEVGGGQTAFGNNRQNRVPRGSLSIGMDQNCFMGCFDQRSAASGAVAAMRLWAVVRSQEEIRQSMWIPAVETPNIALSWQLLFRDEDVASHFNYNFTFTTDQLFPLRFDSPRPSFSYSTAPLTLQNGAPVPPPTAGAAGTALLLSDMQLVMVPNFANFPATEITVEFWIRTHDKCRRGSPFSYAAGEYGKGDNGFLITNQLDWLVSVMEDQGPAGESSGISSANGQWQHIAVTWELQSGRTLLYQNANPMWWVTRNSGAAGGKPLPPNGTLVLGREQDCRGGCFDSARGAVGRSSTPADEEYGAQDFFGAIEEMRVWKRALSALEIRSNIQLDVGALGSRGVNPKQQDLVAYWKFDEGQGYTVKDVTENGNDLLILSEPKWEVVKWLTFCGDGLVAGEEECDDGNDSKNDGCTMDCKVMPGWTCDNTMAPSLCAPVSGDGGWSPPSPKPHVLPPSTPAPAPIPQPAPIPVPGSTPSTFPVPGSSSSSSSTGVPIPAPTGTKGQSSHGGKGGMSGGMIFLTVLLVLVGVVGAGAAWINRDSLLASVAHLLPGNRQRAGWNAMDTDLEELNLGFRPSGPDDPGYAPVPPGPLAPAPGPNMQPL